jgi:Protein of unknown function (DUF2783)
MRIDANLSDPDAFYARLVAAHKGLGGDASMELMSRLVFLLANQIGDERVLEACLAAASEGLARAD